jgi:fluoroacetyl-CoA thioesterase
MWFETHDQHTAHALGNPDVHVLATIYLIGFIETCCGVSVQTVINQDAATVGTRVDVSHRAPALPGARLRVESELVEVRGRHLRFTARVYEHDKVLMDGFHGRAIVSKAVIAQTAQSQLVVK